MGPKELKEVGDLQGLVGWGIIRGEGNTVAGVKRGWPTLSIPSETALTLTVFISHAPNNS